MHLRNNTVTRVIISLLLGFSLCSWAQQNQQGTQPAQASGVQATPLPSDVDATDPALPVWARPATPPPAANNNPPSKGTQPATGTTAGNNPPQPTGPTGQVVKGDKGFTYRANTQNVILPVTVVDDRKRVIMDLRQSDFQVYEDDQPQQIIDFRREDIPVSIGIVVDNSGSMREKRLAVSKAVINLVKASNKDDEVFVVNFNDDSWLDQDFTNNVDLMKEALDRLDSRGGTALYDAVIGSADHLAKAAKRDKKVLLVITDGEDNESRESLENAIRTVQDENGPIIYTIGILGNEGKQSRAKRALESLSLQTGGVALFPKNLDEVDQVSQQVARDIRNQYNITYKPSNPQGNGGYRRVRVVAHASGYKDLQVRTKSGYFAGQQRAASK
jgi:VWFA-related protein